MAQSKKKEAPKKGASVWKPQIESRYKKELPPVGSAKHKSYVMQGLIKQK
jgi:hypothetical protein|tara:strand:+ start:1944 stop:2093 length:150 start_codon:yes stop_codon:yes gene_type:complete